MGREGVKKIVAKGKQQPNKVSAAKKGKDKMVVSKKTDAKGIKRKRVDNVSSSKEKNQSRRSKRLATS